MSSLSTESPANTHAKTSFLQPGFHCSSLHTLDPGSGREIPEMYHGTGGQYQNLSTGNGQAPGRSCILSVVSTAPARLPLERGPQPARAYRDLGPAGGRRCHTAIGRIDLFANSRTFWQTTF